MPCLIGCLALSIPRIVLLFLWLFTQYLNRAFESNFWLLLGFLFLPLTTLAYAWAKNTNGSVEGIYLVVVIVAALIDLGIVSFGRRGGGGGRRRGGHPPPAGPREITITGQRVG